jgi:lysophospholipase L1-like esterase
MPIYHKTGGQWKIAASLYREPAPSLYKHYEGEWKDIKSGWTKVNGKWQQIFQKSSWAKDRTRSIVFVGDSVAWGFGLPIENQFTRLIQSHLNGALGISSVRGVCRSLTVDDGVGNPFGGGYNGILKYTPSSGVFYTEMGPFSKFKGVKSALYKDPMIVIPTNEFIEIELPIGTQYIQLCLDSIQTYAEFEVSLTLSRNTFVDTGSNEGTLLAPFRFDTYADFYRMKLSNLVTQRTTVKLQTQSNHHVLLRSFNGYYFDSFFEELTNMIVQVIARNTYAVEDYVDTTEEIKKSIGYKEYPTANGNYKPLIVIQAGFYDLYYRKKTSAEYKNNLKTLAQKLIEETDVNSPNGEVVLTIPHLPAPYTSLTTIEPRVNYNNAVVEVANELGIHYVDLSALGMTAANYLADGINFNYSGSIKIANKYIEDLGLLSAIDDVATANEYRHPNRGI